MRGEIAKGKEAARALIPLSPRESDAFFSYSSILKRCHEVVLETDTSRNLHRFHALIALRWMQGTPLPRIIDHQIRQNPDKPLRTNIRKTLDLIEGEIRFQLVRPIGCYSALLVHALATAGLIDLVSSSPSLPLYLEIGVCDRIMVSFISLGLSRTTAMKLNELSARKDLNPASALQWLRTRQLPMFGLSPLL